MTQRISFIVPNYNGQNTVLNTLSSIYKEAKALSLADYEVILIDDKSTDDSVAKVREAFPGVKQFVNERNKGAAASRNAGIRRARHEILVLIDNDVRLTDGCLKKLLAHAKSADIVYPCVIFDNGHVMNPLTANEKIFPKQSQIFLVKKSSLARLDETFDETYRIYNEDTDFFLRCKAFGLSAKYVPDAIARHRTKQANASNLEKRYYLEVRNILYSLIKLGPVSGGTKDFFVYPRKYLLVAFLLYGVFNVDPFDTQRQMTFREKVSFLLHRGRKLTRRWRLILLYLYLKALAWNIASLRGTLRKRKRLKKELLKAPANMQENNDSGKTNLDFPFCHSSY